MNKSTIAGIFVAILVAGALIGIYVIPKKVIETEQKKAGADAAKSAAQQSAQNEAADQIRKAAGEISEKLLADQRKNENAPTVDVSSSSPIVIDREAYTMTLPQGSEVDPPHPEDGKERLMHFRMPGHATGSVVVVDSKARALSAVDDTLADVKSKLTDTSDVNAEALAPFKLARLSAIKGSIGTVTDVFEVGVWEGEAKSCIIIINYPVRPNDQAIASLQKAFRTFKMQQ